MKQNALSIDFKDAHVNGNEYSFDYNIMASIVAATEITIQSFMGKSSVPVYFDRVNIRLYPISIYGYFTVGRYSLIFNATVSMDERVSAIESYLSSAVVYRTASGNPAVFSDGTAIDLKALSVTLVPTQSGSGDPSPTNIRPISGVSSVTATRTGKNLLPLTLANIKRYANGGTWNGNEYSLNNVTFTVNLDNDDNVTGITANGTTGDSSAYFRIIANGLPLTPGVSYVLSGCPEGGTGDSYFIYTGSYGANGWIDDDNHKSAKTYVSDWTNLYVVVRQNVTVNNLVFRPMIRLASDADATFKPYQSQSVTVPFVDANNDPLTVYGGTLDVTTGALTVTWANIASYDDETLPGFWISDRDVYTPDTTPTAGAQVVYELATPVTYNLTAQQLAALVGYNSVTTNGDSVYLEYLSSGPPWSG